MSDQNGWLRWVAEETIPGRRHLLVQMIVADQLTYKWLSYDRALDQLLSPHAKGLTPNSDAIKQLARVAQSHEWDKRQIARLYR